MASLLVVDASASVRETLAIILGHEHRVHTTAAFDDVVTSSDAALVIAGLPAPPADAGAAAAILAGLDPATAVLLLSEPAAVASTPLAAGTRAIAFLPKPFDGHALRRRVRELLAPAHAPVARRAVARGTYALEEPFLSREAAALVQRAIGVDFPLVFIGETGCGALEIARAVHLRTRAPATFRAVSARDLTPAEVSALLAPAEAGVFVEGIDALPRASQHALVEALRRDTTGARLYAWTPEPLDDVAARGEFIPELAYALGVLAVRLAPLRERSDDLDALANATSTRIAARLGVAPPTFSPAARERLRRYLWFGNAAELEAVLARTMVFRDPRALGSEDLLFLPEHARPARSAAAEDAAAPATDVAPPPAGVEAARLELVLGELAHELRNPLVTIKTFSQHLDAVLADPEVRARFTSLTADAVTRMDSVLERLLEFARFRAPRRTTTDLAPLLDQALAEQHEELARKSIRIERNGAQPGSVRADGPQVLFALRSLIGGLVPDLIAHRPLRLTAPASGAVEVEAHTEPAAVARLASFIEGAAESEETPTLPFTLAASLLERNGGRLHVRRGVEGATMIRVALTPADP